MASVSIIVADSRPKLGNVGQFPELGSLGVARWPFNHGLHRESVHRETKLSASR